MIVLLIVVLIVSAAGLAITSAFIAHELGLFPHTKDRRSPVDRAFPFRSRYERDVQVTHGFQVMDAMTNVLRRHAHADVYEFRDPYEALENVMNRYKEQPTRSRYDDLVHVANHVCNHVKCNERVNELIGQIHELMQSSTATQGT